MIVKPKTLIFDIETSPCVGWFWNLGKQYIQSNQLISSGKIICISYRFNSWPEGKVKNLRWSSEQSDEQLVKEFSKIAETADLLVGHNGDNFDIKWINARLAYYKQPTLRNCISEDTLKLARKQFRLPSFKLEFLCMYFDVGRKRPTTSKLWEKVVFNKDQKALKEMVLYCNQDVLILDKLYDRLYPYVNHRTNVALLQKDIKACPECGGNKLTKDGFKFTRVGKYQRFSCSKCKFKFKNGINLLNG